ncbi:hypothetical protein EYF80_006342 [Liparis tanakae]|uniref:Uncharacterized protein n=1 Tax=Liparis tanakae TaxID=230148 RepID=A0A4Z2J099_9TELE|nr:hypothetical protein EYF80_006342 [Liparis tanakae]
MEGIFSVRGSGGEPSSGNRQKKTAVFTFLAKRHGGNIETLASCQMVDCGPPFFARFYMREGAGSNPATHGPGFQRCGTGEAKGEEPQLPGTRRFTSCEIWVGPVPRSNSSALQQKVRGSKKSGRKSQSRQDANM